MKRPTSTATSMVKKLEADANVRIVNIRGVGYRLVLGE